MDQILFDEHVAAVFGTQPDIAIVTGRSTTGEPVSVHIPLCLAQKLVAETQRVAAIRLRQSAGELLKNDQLTHIVPLPIETWAVGKMMKDPSPMVVIIFDHGKPTEMAIPIDVQSAFMLAAKILSAAYACGSSDTGPS